MTKEEIERAREERKAAKEAAKAAKAAKKAAQAAKALEEEMATRASNNVKFTDDSAFCGDYETVASKTFGVREHKKLGELEVGGEGWIRGRLQSIRIKVSAACEQRVQADMASNADSLRAIPLQPSRAEASFSC